jgi:ketosteroid isomerase-like protein
VTRTILLGAFLALLAACKTVHVSEPVVPTNAAAVSTAPRAEAAPADVRAEIVARNRELEQLFRRGELAAVAAAYTDDAVLVDPRGTVGVGRAAVDEYWKSIPNPRDWTLELLSLEGDARFAVQRGRSTLVYAPNDAERRSVVEFVVAWRKGDDGIWRIASDTWWSPRR